MMNMFVQTDTRPKDTAIEEAAVGNPTVSVVIPTHERPEGLRSLLKSLAVQSFSLAATEIIVAQDGCDDETVAVVEEIREVTGIPIKHVSRDSGSAAGTRNLGAAEATGEYLLFVDDDCAVDKAWVARMVRRFELAPETGEVVARIVGASSRFFARCHDYARYYPSMQPKPGARGFACGCAFGIRRSLFEVMGGFDVRVKTGEDEDLGLRMQAMGYGAVYDPDCVVFHDHRRHSLRKMLGRAYTWGVRGEVDRHLGDRERSTYGRFASANPFFYLFLSPLISVAVSLRIWARCWWEPRLPLYMPFIFCDKMVWCWATYRYLRAKGGAAA